MPPRAVAPKTQKATVWLTGLPSAGRTTLARFLGGLAGNGVLSVVPVIAPYADSREAVRLRHAKSGTPCIEVHVPTPVEVCRERDVKGLYARQAAGELSALTGVDDAYEAPVGPELVRTTQDRRPPDSADAVYAAPAERGLV
ncbi:adenylyl-sulfate kinase [Streptomyces sp. NPDC060002]|uniref:adenylyl-sulfate kinase n=1 Tax=Streptomyces sp. NPDC060002 TaxID=3347033 RepID=UPI0036CEE73E